MSAISGSNSRAKVIRNNVCSVLRLACKSVIDRSCFDQLDDQIPEVINFCNILENMLYFALKESNRHPWKGIVKCCQNLPHNCLQTIKAMEHLRHEYAKLRAWIRMALMEKRLHEYLAEIISHPDILKQFYTEEAILLASEITAILNTIIGLSALDFGFDLRSQDIGYSGFVPIDYTPYLHFMQSPESVFDDLLECQGHISNEELCPWKTKYIKLERKLKASVEQKSFLEETVNRLDARVDELHIEKRRALALMHKLERVISDLQAHISLVHKQHTSDMVRYGNAERYLPPPPHVQQIPTVAELFPQRPATASFSEQYWDSSSEQLTMVTPSNTMLTREFSHPEVTDQQDLDAAISYRSPSVPRDLSILSSSAYPLENNDHSLHPPHSMQPYFTLPKERAATLDFVSLVSSESRSFRRSLSVDGDNRVVNRRSLGSEDGGQVGGHQHHSTGVQTPDILRRLRSGDLADSAYYQLSADHEVGYTDDECSPNVSVLLSRKTH